MKKFLMVVLVLLVTATVANASSSIHGEYKGNAIVKVTSNGKELTATDVPAQMMDNRTMVPIYMLRQLGATVTWDQKLYTVDVSLPTNNHADAKINNELELLRAHARAADAYQQLDELGQRLASTASGFEVVYNHYMLGTDPGIDINTANKAFNLAIDRYNWALEETLNLKRDLSNKNIDVSMMDTILTNYSKSIDYLRKSYVALEQLSVRYTKEQYNIYFQNGSTAMSYAHDYSAESYKKYTYHISLIK